MGIEKFYKLVRRKLGLEKQQLKSELKKEVTEELREELEEEISYIEAQMKEYEQLVAEVNHLLAKMRREDIKGKSGEEKQVRMNNFEQDLEPLKSKLQRLEKSMQERLNSQTARS